MIVKNEQDFIADCLDSVSSIVSEIIIADTGSTDKTVEIAKAKGAQVFNYTWQDDFAAARNATIEKATCDWILILDADEVIAQQDLGMFKHLISDRTRCIEFLQRHYTDDIRLSEFTPCTQEFPLLEKNYPGYFESNCVRLFPNHDGLYYQFRVHELVEPSIQAKGIHRIERTQVRIHHYGHTPEVRAKKKKGEIYTPLGEKKIQDQPTDWKAFYELGVEANVNGRKEESINAFQQSIKLNPKYVPTWVNFGYVLMESQKFQEAFDVLMQAIKLDPNNAEAFCNLGVVGLRTNNLKLAEEASVKAILINPNYINALRNLARCYISQGRISEAVMILKRAHASVPQFSPILHDLYLIYDQSGQKNISAKYLQKLKLIDPSFELSN